MLSVYGKSDELVISNTLSPERAIEAATTRLQHHKIGLSYNEESFVLNAKNPDNVICNFLDKYVPTAGEWDPVLSFGGASVGITYSLQEGRWQKVGNKIDFILAVMLTSKGTSTGEGEVAITPTYCSWKRIK